MKKAETKKLKRLLLGTAAGFLMIIIAGLSYQLFCKDLTVESIVKTGETEVIAEYKPKSVIITVTGNEPTVLAESTVYTVHYEDGSEDQFINEEPSPTQKVNTIKNKTVLRENYEVTLSNGTVLKPEQLPRGIAKGDVLESFKDGVLRVKDPDTGKTKGYEFKTTRVSYGELSQLTHYTELVKGIDAKGNSVELSRTEKPFITKEELLNSPEYKVFLENSGHAGHNHGADSVWVDEKGMIHFEGDGHDHSHDHHH